MPENYEDALAELTGGRPFVFVIMGYGDRQLLYERVAAVVRDEFGIECLRADEIKNAGYDLLSKIHWLIEHAEAVVAEISVTSQNVFYEVGYAVASNKSPLLLVEKSKAKKIPTDLKGLEKIEYALDQAGTARLEQELVAHLRPRVKVGVNLLRDMLLAEKRDNNYILSSPKYPGPECRIWGQVYDTQTFGDYLAILGLVSAFGSMLGPGRGVELISAQHSPPDAQDRPWNLYLIGSRKVNPLTESVLSELQKGSGHWWCFDPLPGEEEKGDWPSALYECEGGERLCRMGVHWQLDEAASGNRIPVEGRGRQRAVVWKEDYGLILRGPHPNPANGGRLVLFMAGAHSLGTGAAGIATTNPEKIKQIRDMLPPGTLENKQSKFWVLVKGVANEEYRLDPEGVFIERVGIIG
ncbi:hypothetical protein LLH23_03465 [bacterium]|nr:hypothetical protein [bacterium]